MGGWVHRCALCGWGREAASPTVLSPHCDNCGGLLEAVVAGTPEAVVGSPPLHAHTVSLSPVFGRVLRWGLLALLMFAAARFGWQSGGSPLALTAVGVVGLFTVPLIVEG